MRDRAPGSFALVVRFTVRAGAEETFDSLTEATVAQVREREPGTLVYACNRVEGHLNERIFYEMYRDRAAFEDHQSREYVRRFLEDREQLLVATEVDWLEPTVAKVQDHETENQ